MEHGKPEGFPQLVRRLREAKYGTMRDADRATGIPYSTWQNLELRGTEPTLTTLTLLADKLEVSELELLNAWRVSQGGPVPTDPPPEDTPRSRRRPPRRGGRPGTGSTRR